MCLLYYSHRTLHPTKQSSTTPGGVLQFNPILTQYAWRWRQIPRVKGSVPQDCSRPTFEAKRKARLSPVLLTNWLSIRGPQDFSSCLINLLEWLTDLRKTVTYIYRFLKDTDEQPDGETQRTRYVGRVWSFRALSGHPNHPAFPRNLEDEHIDEFTCIFWFIYAQGIAIKFY